MSNEKSEEESKKEYIEIMGKELGTVHNELWQELAWLHFKWGEYEELFIKKNSRIDLLNNSAPFFFGMVQSILWENVLIHIARLTDPPESFGKKNLTVKLLPSLVKDELKEELEENIRSAENAASFCRDWRNRKIAHADYDLAINKKVTPLKPANYKMVEEALKKIVDVINTVSKGYLKSETAFISSALTGGESLLYIIDEGLRAREERERRIESGEYNEHDIDIREL